MQSEKVSSLLSEWKRLRPMELTKLELAVAHRTSTRDGRRRMRQLTLAKIRFGGLRTSGPPVDHVPVPDGERRNLPRLLTRSSSLLMPFVAFRQMALLPSPARVWQMHLSRSIAERVF